MLDYPESQKSSISTSNSHILIRGSISHWDVIRIIEKWMNGQAMIFGSCGQAAQQLGDLLLIIDGKIILWCPEEDDTSFADGDGQVADLVFKIGRIKHLL